MAVTDGASWASCAERGGAQPDREHTATTLDHHTLTPADLPSVAYSGHGGSPELGRAGFELVEHRPSDQVLTVEIQQSLRRRVDERQSPHSIYREHA